MVQTIDSEKLAESLNNSWERANPSDQVKLKVLIQINTSGEKEKNGCDPENAVQLFRFIKEKCPLLHIDGVMTIGEIHDLTDGKPNPDFISLVKCHKDICNTFELDENDFNISMGMSADFENAVSTNFLRNYIMRKCSLNLLNSVLF